MLPPQAQHAAAGASRLGPLGAALLLQAVLLAWRLDLLPRWDDELFTLRVVAGTPAEILQASRAGVHPPLYFLLAHAWLKLPLPGDTLIRLRALSALFALAATVALYQLWLRPLDFRRRALFLGLWAFSPFLVLYARMARSYTLQLLLVIVVLRFACRWLRNPSDWRAAAGYIAFAGILLYTHYLPGLAVTAAIGCAGLLRRHWRHLAVLAAVAALYLPWLTALAAATRVVAHTKPYFASPNPFVEALLRLAYAFAAMNFGESMPLWSMLAAALLTPGILWAVWRARRSADHPSHLPAPSLLALIGLIGFGIAFSRVSFPFVGARLLFLLPFYYLVLLAGLDGMRRRGVLIYSGMLVLSASGLDSYYRRDNFLNKGYLLDFRNVAATVRAESEGEPSLVLLDSYTESAGYYLHGDGFPYPAIIVRGHADDAETVLGAVHRIRPRVLWFVRSGRDLSPGGLYERLEQKLERDYAVERHFFVAYSEFDRLVMQWLGWRNRPTHLVEALEMRERSRGGSLPLPGGAAAAAGILTR